MRGWGRGVCEGGALLFRISSARDLSKLESNRRDSLLLNSYHVGATSVPRSTALRKLR